LAEPHYRVLAIGSHPVQYMAPLLRRMARHPQLDLSVAYCMLRGAEPTHDPDFNTTVQWDVPLLEGYVWKEIPNKGSGEDSFWGLYNPGLWGLIRQEQFDAVLCYLPYLSASFWISLIASKVSGSAFLFGTDASSLSPRSGSGWKIHLKKALWPRLYSLADQVIVPSNAGRDLMVSLKLPSDHITLTPYVVDNDWWAAQSQLVDRDATRSQWRATTDTCVILFCAKLQPWKRPMDLLRAFARANIANSLLVFAGEGPQRQELKSEALRLNISERMRFLGFCNQTQLPAIYTSADLMVLPSEYEPFAVVVNEASCCGCPVVASDHVGATRDLIAPVDPQLIYPCGNVDALAALLQDLCADRARLCQLRKAFRQRISSWSPEDNVAATIKAVAAAVQRRRG
jgi:glycosyltransferase involved in cell wall biosynthesis